MAGHIVLAPITPASYLAARAALRIEGPHDTCDLGALAEADLVAFVDVTTVSADTLTFVDADALRSVAASVYATWLGALAMHDARARAEVAFVAMNWWPPQEDGDPFVPEMMARGEGWAQLRDLPMWEASMAGMIATAWAHRTKTVREMSNE